jgi:leucyl/phenylalanyl-tRNA--protein transferase
MNLDSLLADVLDAYAAGLFPMADQREDSDIYWYDPPKRGQLSIHDLHVSRSLRRTVLKQNYDIKIDSAFEGVIDLCAEAAKDRPQTWINQGIRDLFVALHHAGYAHSVEVWTKQETPPRLVGGLYGLALGKAFMGESMVSRTPDASKIALVHLCARLKAGGFTILDTQFVNEHLKQFGVYEIDRDDYLQNLAQALKEEGDFILPAISEETLLKAYFSL